MIIDRPRGIIPRSKGCGLGPEYACVAENLNTRSGRFESWREPVRLLGFEDDVCVAHVRDCCWHGTHVAGARYIDAGNPKKTYLSSPDQRPVVTDDLCDPNWCFLGYPVPGEPLARRGDTGGIEARADTQSQTYRITYGTACEEGPASCPTNVVKRNKDTEVIIELPEPPDSMWCADTVRIYRQEVLWDSEQGLVEFNPNAIEAGWTSASVESDYFLVATLDIHHRFWKDKGQTCTNNLLISEGYLPPPEGMMIADETTSGSLVGWKDNEVFFSERNSYHAFPHKGVHCFPDEVMNVCVCGDTVFVFTCHEVYLLSDSVDCQDTSARTVQVLKDAPKPVGVSCGQLPDGVLYISNQGLARLTSSGSVSLVSDRTFEKDDWSLLGPSHISLKISCRRVFLRVPGGQVYIWDLTFDETGSLPADVTTLSFCPDQWVCDEKDHLYFLHHNTIYQFNAGGDYMRMNWKQAEQRFANREKVSGILGDYVKKNNPNHNKLSIYRDGQLSVQKDLREKATRVRGSATRCLQIQVQGTEPMCYVAYGSGLNELNRRPT